MAAPARKRAAGRRGTGTATAMSANIASAAVGSSGTVTLPSTATIGSRVTAKAASNACRSVKPQTRAAANNNQIAAMAIAAAATRATSSEGSSSFITPPVNQNGNGSQLVPVGSSFG